MSDLSFCTFWCIFCSDIRLFLLEVLIDIS
jgi:hypothetical protein